MMRRGKYLNEEYRQKIRSFLDGNPELSNEVIESRYVRECEQFDEAFQDGTPLAAIRRLAWVQTKHKLKRSKNRRAENALAR